MNAYADFDNYLPVQTLSAFELSRDARDMCFGLVCVDHHVMSSLCHVIGGPDILVQTWNWSFNVIYTDQFGHTKYMQGSTVRDIAC